MTEQDYFAELDKIKQLQEAGNDKAVACYLEKLYEIKPVRLSWYVAKAMHIWKTTGSVRHTFQILADKGWHLYDYPGLQEMTNLSMALVSSYKDIPALRRQRLLFNSICKKECVENQNWEVALLDDFRQTKINFLKNPESERIALNLRSVYFSSGNPVMFLLMFLYMQSINPSVSHHRKEFLQFTNYGILMESLSPKEEIPFIVLEDENSDGLDEKVLLCVLQKFQKNVYYLKAPVRIEVDHEVDLCATVDSSIDTMEIVENLYTIYPVSVICNRNVLGDNREYILNYLLENQLKDQFALVFTNDILMENLCRQPVLKKNLERLYHNVSTAFKSQIVFGWMGDYLAYISQIHLTDVRKLLDKPTACSYSVIIPARNSSATLRCTLMSCLTQRYQGNYEIVLSDNSTPGNTEVYQLYKELYDPRIKYYRTPREYNLSRSFEFAYLHARGEFLLSLGSDDALLPWALEELDKLRKQYPDENIIQWERGFYAWPGFNGGQQNQFIIPGKYQKNDFCPKYLNRQFYLNSLFTDSNRMYILPNLYLNSGCRREYLRTILSKTGRLFDGICQDIYMGIVNITINEKILNIEYPLVIAGMSDNSMGAKANLIYKLSADETDFLNDLKYTANIGGYCPSPYECLMPEVTTDKSSLYNCILRMIARGVILESDLEYIDFRKWFLDVYRQMDIRDPMFDKKIHYFRYTASMHGEKFLQWFDETIYYPALQPYHIDSAKIAKARNQKSYTEGEGPAGSLTLDASKYHVKNVYDASKLFERISGL